jgi:predicted alpha/beta superfamily hydrolase
MHESLIHVHYPLKEGTLVLRTEQNWDKDILAEEVCEERKHFLFRIKHKEHFIAYKPALIIDGQFFFEDRPERLAFQAREWIFHIYPHFLSGSRGIITDIIQVSSKIYKKKRKLRLYLPAGYEENTLKRYSVVYMHDGKNLFFPQEAFLGQDWEVEQNLDLLATMNLTEQMIVVGIYAGDREGEYTAPGYERFGNSLVSEVKPWIDKNFRTIVNPWHTAVMGSSLGGVVSFYLAWEYPEIFGAAACLSSSFTLRDDLMERVEKYPIEPRKNLKIYIDSGWPGDNYDATLRMGIRLLERGFLIGENLFHFAFPLAKHSEKDWSSRLHVPLQIFSGRLRKAQMLYYHKDARYSSDQSLEDGNSHHAYNDGRSAKAGNHNPGGAKSGR